LSGILGCHMDRQQGVSCRSDANADYSALVGRAQVQTLHLWTISMQCAHHGATSDPGSKKHSLPACCYLWAYYL
jgi:hypothetical protein